MTRPKLAVCIDDLRADVKQALSLARSLEFQAIEVKATEGPISPTELSQTGRRHLLRHLADLGLRIASLRGPTGPGGYADPRDAERRLDALFKVLDLAAGLRAPVVSTTLGATGSGGSARLREALAAIADRADRAGVAVALETAGVASAELGRVLKELNCPWVASCCDTGAMIIRGEDPHCVSEPLAGRIRLVRARDAVGGTPAEPGHEVRLGEGQLDPLRLLSALAEAGFGGDIVVSRTTGERPLDDLRHARRQFSMYLT